MKYKLLLDDGSHLAAWDNPEWEPNYSFPDLLWSMGIMLLSGNPVTVVGGVELIENGRRKWRRNVPIGAARKRKEVSIPPTDAPYDPHGRL